MEALRVLHISDLHFGTDGQVQSWTDDKYGNPELKRALEPNVTGDLIRAIGRACGEAEVFWPKAIIVSGDLVNFGGGLRVKTEPNREFDHAKTFLDRLASEFNVKRERVFVVPGNHDVDWTKGLGYLERFNNFIKATSGRKRDNWRRCSFR